MDGKHISDEELLLEADGELAAARMVAVREHLEACWGCWSRKAGLARVVEGYVAQHLELDEQIPQADGARAMLRARLGVVSGGKKPVLVAFSPVLGWVALAAALVLGILMLRGGKAASVIPVAALTPGATRAMELAAVCAAGEEEGPQITAVVAAGVFRSYGIRNPKPRSYEVDYLIPPSLGGSDDVRNLWPQPYESGVWNARVKDALEDRLRMLVCERKLDLAVAQADLARDWIAAYRKYFRTEQPLLHHVAFFKDRPWE